MVERELPDTHASPHLPPVGGAPPTAVDVLHCSLELEELVDKLALPRVDQRGAAAALHDVLPAWGRGRVGRAARGCEVRGRG